MNIPTTIRLLQEARRRLEHGENNFICHALVDAGLIYSEGLSPEDEEVVDTAVSELHDYILAQLGSDNFGSPMCTMANWLQYALRQRFGYGHTFRITNNTMFQARLAWVDRMLCQLNEDGTLP